MCHPSEKDGEKLVHLGEETSFFLDLPCCSQEEEEEELAVRVLAPTTSSSGAVQPVDGFSIEPFNADDNKRSKNKTFVCKFRPQKVGKSLPGET